MPFYHARLLDCEGRVWAEIGVSDERDILEVAIVDKIKYQKNPEPVAPVIKKVQFKFERIAGDGVLIYRRITPLWK